MAHDPLSAGGNGSSNGNGSAAMPHSQSAENGKAFPYPGIPTTCDGAEAVVHVEINVTQGAGAFPITSSTTMGGGYNTAVMNGWKNLWGDPLLFVEPESEHSAASFCEGFAAAGGRVTNFTSGQGLVLMKEVLYTISGKRLPVVMNIGARALTSQALNVHAGHDDVMSVADCGWGMLFGRNAQEAGDLCLICRRAAEASFTPFFNVQDGFLTTHTVETVRLPEPEFMKEYIGEPEGEADQPDGSGQPDDVGRGAESRFVHEGQDRPALVLRPRRAGILRGGVRPVLSRRPAGATISSMPYRCEDAEYIVVGMGCYMETCEGHGRLPARKQGHQGGLPDRVLLPPVPVAADRRRTASIARRSPCWNGWTIRCRRPAIT